MDFLKTVFSSDGFMPHGFCYLWNAKLVWLHVVSDSLIALAYLFIPITLVYFIRKRRDLPFNWMFVCFGLFILACGATHAMEVWTLWHADYWLSGAVKAFTALVSVPTAILLVRMIPRALALPSPEAMRSEIEARKSAQESLHVAKAQLEVRVVERTAELTKANKVLVLEVAERARVEEELRRSEERFRLLVDTARLCHLHDGSGWRCHQLELRSRAHQRLQG
jgi:PAS domain-containing protein